MVASCSQSVVFEEYKAGKERFQIILFLKVSEVLQPHHIEHCNRKSLIRDCKIYIAAYNKFDSKSVPFIYNF